MPFADGIPLLLPGGKDPNREQQQKAVDPFPRSLSCLNDLTAFQSRVSGSFSSKYVSMTGTLHFLARDLIKSIETFPYWNWHASQTRRKGHQALRNDPCLEDGDFRPRDTELVLTQDEPRRIPSTTTLMAGLVRLPAATNFCIICTGVSHTRTAFLCSHVALQIVRVESGLTIDSRTAHGSS
jgi:hypothetical protein